MLTAEVSGIIAVNKPQNMTSHDVVNIIRRLYGTKSVGHTGTLDPMATGLLTVLVGRAVKASEYLVCDSKRYRSTLRLGVVTDTGDITGKVLKEASESLPDADSVIKTCREKFTGRIAQIPPMYSALKIGGRKLCDLARRGQTVEREAREIEIFSLSCTPTQSPCDFILEIHCSSGTYIRTLCEDIGRALGCGGTMAALERTEAGGFDLSQSHTIDELRGMTPEALASIPMAVENLFLSLAKINLPPFFEHLCRNGCEIYQKKIGTIYDVGTRVRLCSQNGVFFALGEVRSYPDGTAVKALKFFDISDRK